MTGIASLTLPQRVAANIALLCAAVAVRGGRDHAATPLVLLVWTHLRRILTRFDRLMARLAAGRPPITRRPPAAPVTRKPAASRFPRGMGWLMREFPETRGCGLSVHILLADPELVALIATNPAAARILRPLYRMVALPPPPSPPAPRRPRKPRPAAPPRPDPPDMPHLLPGQAPGVRRKAWEARAARGDPAKR